MGKSGGETAELRLDEVTGMLPWHAPGLVLNLRRSAR